MSDTPFVRIVWNNCTIGEWNELLRAVARSTIPQTFAYGEAMLLTERWQPRFGLIEADDRPVGLVLALEKRMAKVVRVAKIHRGPLWLSEPEPAVLAAALKALRAAYPPGITRWTTFVPELPAGEAARAALKAAGFRPMKGEGYRTLWLDLRQAEEELRRGLKGNWRNHLNQSLKSGLTLENDREHKGLPWLVERHLKDKEARGYRGLSGPLAVRLRNALHKGGAKEHGVLLLRAMKDGEPVAGVLMLRHGRTATYQIGWNGPEGRKVHAHQFLVWHAILELKRQGVEWLDLGGINPTGAPGVSEFKRGLGAEEIELAGTFV